MIMRYFMIGFINVCFFINVAFVEAGFIYNNKSLEASLNLSSLNGTNGFVINGVDAYDKSGYSVSGAGDVNGDGLDDLLIGAYGANSSTGESYVVYGILNDVSAELDLSSLNGTNGFVINGIDSFDYYGYSVSGAGDVNGDGLDDLLLGAYQADPNGKSSAGESYVVYGAPDGRLAELDLSSLNGTNGFVINGIDAYDFSGREFSGVGDVNGDGLDDLLIGAYQADPKGKSAAGESYVVYGTTNGFSAVLNLSSLNGTNGFVINGIDATDYSGYSVSGAGDVNGDGLDDLLIGAYQADPGGNSAAGESYVVYGTTNGFSAALNLSSLNGDNGFVINGVDAYDKSGCSVSGAGDVNGDGLDDLLIGAYGANSSVGESYVVYGTTNGFSATLNLSSLNGTNGFVINGIDADWSGYSVSGAGDVNGDGFDDLMIGAYQADPNGNSAAGESYVVYGTRNDVSATLNLSSLNGTNGFMINGINEWDKSGRSVSGAGDVNGDGLDDLLIGAYGADPSGKVAAGESYVVYGALTCSGVSPSSGSFEGGYQVVISGIDLGNGSDVTNVTLNGRSASIISQSSAQIVVTAASGKLGIGDVVVSSSSYGTTTKADAFTYLGSEFSVLGTNGASIASGELASSSAGTRFAHLLSGDNETVMLTITNGSVATINISGWDTTGTDASMFTISGIGSSVDVGSIDTFDVQYSPTSLGSHSASLSIASDGSNSPFILNLSGSAYALDVNNGAAAGGNSITITNGLLGNGYDITNVTVGGVSAIITGQGTDWVTITLPAGTPGIKDIVIQSTSVGNTTLVGSYTVNPAGFIYVLEASLNLSSLNGTNGFVIAGIDSHDQSGSSVSGAGDVNGDGLDDLLIGAPNGNSSAGESYVVYGTTNGFSATLDLTSLNGVNGFVIKGVDLSESSGCSVSGTGDVNGDGVDDLLIGAYWAYGESSYAGKSYVVYGTPNGFSATLDLSSLNGTNGFVIKGIDQYDLSGSSVSGAGDVNGDGLDDLIVGANGAARGGELYVGESYVVYGITNGFSASLNLSSLNGTNGFVINGIDALDRSGSSVSGAGDVNGDGVDDLLIGAWQARPNGKSYAGESYVVYGTTNGFSASLNLSSLNGTNGFIINGVDVSDYSGYSVSGAGDVNSDGLDDLLIGAYNARADGEYHAGESYVVYGTTNEFSATLNLSSLNGANGFVINGIDEDDFSGSSVSGAGDVNGDGLSDLLIGAYGANSFAGESYVVYGTTNGFSATLNLSSLNGVNGFIINGIDANDQSGHSVSGAGDVNGDGVDDLLIGAYFADPGGNSSAGESYVVYGARLVRGVSPNSGSSAGGYQVKISGTNLCNGTDIINVTLNGSSVTSIDSQSSTQLVVTAASGKVGTGDVVVYSSSYGTTTQTDAFTYLGSELSVLGSNGVSVASGEAVSSSAGTDFLHLLKGDDATVRLTILNSGNQILNISDWTTNGSDAAFFTITGIGSSLAVGATDTFDVQYSPTSVGSHSISLSIASDDLYSPFILNISGSSYDLDVNVGAAEGGNSITITNGLLGNGLDITNVTVGGVSAIITGQGTDWVTITLPAGTAGAQDIIIQSASVGDTTLANAYTFYPAGQIGGIIKKDWSQWEEVASLPVGVGELSSATLNGSIYAMGGAYVNNVYRFDGMNWEAVAGLPYALADSTAVEMGGFIYLAGGKQSSSVYHRGVYRFDGSLWSEVSALPQALCASAGTMFNGSMVIAGGITTFDSYLTDVYQFDGSSWTSLPGMPSEMAHFGAGSINSNLYVFGGNAGTITSNVFGFDGTSWSVESELPVSLEGMGSAVLDDIIYSIGGFANTAQANVYRFDGTNWTEVAGLPAARSYLGGTTLNGQIYAIGGYDNNGVKQANVYRYPLLTSSVGVDPTMGNWAGGYQVVISGTNLCDGTVDDISSVTLCGCEVQSVDAVNGSTQIVVTVGIGTVQRGDVKVTSKSYGSSISSNAFSYLYGPKLVFDYTGVDFESTNMVLTGDSTWYNDGLTDHRLLLTPSILDRMGSAWVKEQRLNPSKDWMATWVANPNYPQYNGPAKGVGFHLQTNGTWLNAEEYYALYHSGALSVRLNNYGADYLSIYCNGRELSETAVNGLLIDMTTANPIDLEASYNSAKCELTVSLYQPSTGVRTNVVNNIDLGVEIGTDPVAVFGFSGRTGRTVGCSENNQIDAFTIDGNFGAPEMMVLDMTGQVIDNGISFSKGGPTDFGYTPLGVVTTLTYSITNSGSTVLTIDSWVANGVDAAEFTVTDMPLTVDAGAVSDFSVTASVTAVGQKSFSLVITPNLLKSYTINFGIDTYDLSTNVGSLVGGSSITITNGLLGNGSDITNVTIGGESATITGQGTDWVTIILPPGTAGVQDIIIQSTSVGDTTLANAFTYTKVSQTIDFPAIENQLSNSTVVLQAMATSGLPVSFSVASGPASIDGGTNLTLSVEGTVSITASQAGDANWSMAPDVINTFDVIEGYTLTVVPGYAGAYPGTETVVSGTALSQYVTNSPVSGGVGTQYLCVGGVVSGNDYVFVSPTNVTLTLTNNATLSWQWDTNYWLETEAGEHGSVSISNSWRQSGATVDIDAVADVYYHFMEWTGDVTAINQYDNPLSIQMDAPRTATAWFAENMATNKTPEWWLALYGWTNDFDVVSLDDADSDGLLTWEEWVAGTIPTNILSCLTINDLALAYGSNYWERTYTNHLGEWVTQRVYEVVGNILDWPSVSGRVYSVWTSTNLVMGFDSLIDATNLLATPPHNSYEHLTDHTIFYRIGVRRE